jgi:hypothetical protein
MVASLSSTTALSFYSVQRSHLVLSSTALPHATRTFHDAIADLELCLPAHMLPESPNEDTYIQFENSCYVLSVMQCAPFMKKF